MVKKSFLDEDAEEVNSGEKWLDDDGTEISVMYSEGCNGMCWNCTSGHSAWLC
jgi:hypothetical protein